MHRSARLLALALLLGCGGAAAPDAGADAPAIDTPALPVPGERLPVPPPCGPNGDTAAPARIAPVHPATLGMLRVEGTRLVDESGAEVALRGVNAGSWLQTESWILGLGAGYDDDFLAAMVAEAEARGLTDLLGAARGTNAADFLLERRSRWALVQEWRGAMWRRAAPERRAEVEAYWAWVDAQPWLYEEESLWAYFEERFGAAEADALRTALQDRWFTELDVERMAALGLTAIRLPVWYRQLEEDLPDGTARYRPEGWRRLDLAVDWARAHGLYVILDLHGAPGGQSVYDHQGLRYGGDLFRRSECVDRTAALWAALAEHFAGEPHIAAYDLLNEPQTDSAEDWARVHDALYDAVRAVDAVHVVMAEDGYAGPEGVRSPRELGWENAMFSIHIYPFGWDGAAGYAAAIERSLSDWGAVWDARFGVPLLLGEFSSAPGGPAGITAAEQVAAMDAAMRLLGERGVHWTSWTWRFHSETTWGVYHPPAGAMGFFDPQDATLAEVQARFAAMDPAAWVPLTGFPEALAARAADPLSPLALPGAAP